MNTKTLIMEDTILTVPEVALYLKISKSKIYYLVSMNQIPHLRLGRNVRIRQLDLQKWLTQQTNSSSKTFSVSS
ncbi:MAG: helix-turn-helix domain-containing protein [Anaerolineales bacterium]|nr:helix-turn-helix domain-containing protein [Anaerolineales bacterium]